MLLSRKMNLQVFKWHKSFNLTMFFTFNYQLLINQIISLLSRLKATRTIKFLLSLSRVNGCPNLNQNKIGIVNDPVGRGSGLDILYALARQLQDSLTSQLKNNWNLTCLMCCLLLYRRQMAARTSQTKIASVFRFH